MITTNLEPLPNQYQLLVGDCVIHGGAVCAETSGMKGEREVTENHVDFSRRIVVSFSVAVLFPQFFMFIIKLKRAVQRMLTSLNRRVLWCLLKFADKRMGV